MGTNKVSVCHLRNGCIGCGSCAAIAPDHWSMNPDDGKSDLKDAEWKGNEFMVVEVDEEERAINEQAAAACPVNVIRVGCNN
jgi:ferredoxin